MVASLGIERWSQRAGELARVMCKHTVVVSRWVSEGRRLRGNDQDFSNVFEALDKALSQKTIDQFVISARNKKERKTGAKNETADIAQEARIQES